MSLRRFTSLLITFAFIVMTYTGVILFLTPKGRVANWIDWELFGLTKGEYEGLHVTFMIIFIVGMVLHLYLNWKPLVSYFKNRVHNFSLLTKEFALSFGITIVFIVGTLGEIPPFQTLLDFQEDIKNSWEKKGEEAPYGHAEEAKLKDFAKKIGQDVNKALKLMEEANIKGASQNATVKEIAKFNNISAGELYKIISPTYNKNKAKATKTKTTSIIYPKQGEGLGRMNLEEVGQKYGINVEKAIKILKSKGVDATKETKFKKASEELDLTPMELFEEFVK